MTTALTTTNGAAPMEARTLEAVVVGGDLSKLTPDQRITWYRLRCEAAGLDPRTQPFQYITLQGKLTLYATKAATDQLISSRRLSVQIVNRGIIGDLYEAICRVTFPDGHHVEDMAALPVAGLRGDALANAVMKCVTKAKRRTVLSACGLGMLDEGETETIPQAITGGVDVVTGEVVRNEPTLAEVEASMGGQDNQPPKAANTQAKADEWGRTSAAFWATVREAATGQGIPSEQVEPVVYFCLGKVFNLEKLHDLTAPKLKAFGKRLAEPGKFAEEWSAWMEAQPIPDSFEVEATEVEVA